MEGIKLTQAPATLRRLGHQLRGTLHLMKHHMVFKAENREIWICYPIIAELSRTQSTIRVVCKDFMFLAFDFDAESDCRLALETIDQLRQVSCVDELYAFVYSPASLERTFNGWTIYDAEREYARMGALEGAEPKWRLSAANANHALCSTYPRTLAVPSNISDNVLAYAAKFRSKRRLPVLSYYLRLNQCTISRCSQPLVGLKQSRNMQDEAVIAAMWQSNEGPRDRHGAQHDHLIVDLRPSTNAIAQVALGGGTENMDRYKPARKVYMGVDNLHMMRDSLLKVTDALRHSDVGDEPPNPNALERSQWLKHVGILVESSRAVVEQVYYKCSHVVVHCSDGWDRTPQITSLAMLCLDPYYRTLEGFMVLVEKEWVSFGHQFALRASMVNNKAHTDSELDEADLFTNVTNFLTETAKGSQAGPIFQQFLDCVHQLLVVWPDEFEFNERFLRRLMYHTYAGQYGTFLFNSERELLANEAPQRTRSVWDYFLARRAQFVNPKHQTSQAVLVVPQSWRPRWWAGAFGRADSDMNDPDAWRRRPPVRKPLATPTPPEVQAPPHIDSPRAGTETPTRTSTETPPRAQTPPDAPEEGPTAAPKEPAPNEPQAVDSPDFSRQPPNIQGLAVS